MKVIRQKSPRVDHQGPALGELGEAADKIIPVSIIPEDALTIESSRHDVVEGSRGIQAWSSRHDGPKIP
jgi:hypothetical protein